MLENQSFFLNEWSLTFKKTTKIRRLCLWWMRLLMLNSWLQMMRVRLCYWKMNLSNHTNQNTTSKQKMTGLVVGLLLWVVMSFQDFWFVILLTLLVKFFWSPQVPILVMRSMRWFMTFSILDLVLTTWLKKISKTKSSRLVWSFILVVVMLPVFLLFKSFLTWRL